MGSKLPTKAVMTKQADGWKNTSGGKKMVA